MTKMLLNKTKKRLDFLQQLKEQKIEKYEIKKLFLEKFNVKKDVFYDLWHLLEYGTHNNHRRKKGLKTKLHKISLHKQEDGCYFCGLNAEVEHHISYTPEKTTFLCKKCHSKLHIVIKEYHNNNLEREIELKNCLIKLEKIRKMVRT